ncbi:MAG TPA: carboxypeptidase-like regulatory domain-containing protein, partial [Thermoanaerobaculia bacterium]|nr:carboxypeptidase-like regulatory domain-containing protein [Thermoanaerobaculia bacterium]
MPEDLLPKWAVQPGGTTRIPVARGETWRIRVTGPGFGTWWLDVPPDRATVELSPLAAKDHELKIVDDAGGALAAARLSLLDEAPERGGSKKLADHRADARGRVVLRAIPDVAGVLLVASTPTRAPHVVQARPSSLPASIVLSPGAVVRGRLTDAEGKPIARARVGVRTWIAENVPVPLLRESESAADGTWEVVALPAGRGEWRAAARGFAPVARAVTLAASTIDLGIVVLDREVRVAVEVRDERGQPVEGAQLSVRDTVIAATDAEGRATVPAIEGQSFELTAGAPHHRGVTMTVPVPFPKPVEIALARAFRVTGRLVESGGAPVADAMVSAVRGTTLSRHRTDASGRFDLDLEAGVAHTLEFRSTQSALVAIEVAEGLAGESRDLGDVTAPAGVVVTGKLVREDDGSPVSGARVWMPRPSEAGALMAWAFRDVLQTVTDSSGTFRLAGLPATPFVVRIDAPGLATARRAVTPEESEAPIDLGEIRLRAGATVIVRMDGDAGEGAEARIDLGGRGLPIDSLRAPVAGGRASIAQVPAGDVVVSVWRRRDLLCREQATIAESGDSEVVCSMRKVAVSGRVDVGGHPTGPGTVVWLSATDNDTPTGVFNFGSGAYRQQQVFAPDSATYTSNVGYDGTFTVQLLPGTWEVLWMPDAGQAVGPRRVDVPRAATHQVLLSYPAAVLHGRVVDAQRRGVAGADVRELGGRGMAVTRADGTFVLSGPPPGQWEVQARHAGRASAVLTVTAEENRRGEPVTIVLDAVAHAVRVQVLVDRVPAAAAIVFVETDTGELRLATTKTDGTA